ncbi:hypothetical protein [Haloactinopolyspora alba]|uniref:hypothetical protein n=1 Tax=Haloactinopolyspora alba TaxID=648780 RepID=UPI00101D7789|nr:hypothetical protein [Haloactinopolyspora alba]
MADADGPWRLVDSLHGWAERTPWCDWLELAGSLARDAGDAWSDVDAGVGVVLDGVAYTARRDDVLAAVRGFAAVADELIQPLGTDERPADHLVLQYEDGRQLSVVVMAAEDRSGLPPGARALFDRSGRLSRESAPPVVRATDEQRREWAFLAWWSLADVAKHAGRGRLWRALESLHEARTHAWRLYVAAAGVDYPLFGVVSAENAGLPGPAGMASTVPASVAAPSIRAAGSALAGVLEPLTSGFGVDGVRAHARSRL